MKKQGKVKIYSRISKTLFFKTIFSSGLVINKKSIFSTQAHNYLIYQTKINIRSSWVRS